MTTTKTLELRPTHTCFDDALDFISEAIKRVPFDERMAVINSHWLVHGVLKMPDGRPYSHAWVEVAQPDGEWRCWGAGILPGGMRAYYAAVRREYYEHMRVTDDVTRYTLGDAWRLNYESGHYGPWKPEYKALCADGKH